MTPHQSDLMHAAPERLALLLDAARAADDGRDITMGELVAALGAAYAAALRLRAERHSAGAGDDAED